MKVIKFYSVTDEYGGVSNFVRFPIKIENKNWPTTEHYFQAQKFIDACYQEKIRKVKTPMIAAILGRDRKQKIRNDWNSVRCNIMKKALLAKFTQHQELSQLLYSTGDAKLIEHTDNDDYWGDGGDGKGKNMLGRILMEIRETLHKQDESL